MKPKSLQAGDTIGIVTPSSPISLKQKHLVQNAVNHFKTLSIKTVFSKHAFATDQYGASCASPQAKAQDINHMFANPQVNAIWCVHGGDTANQALDFLDFKLIKTHPKIFLGKSDIDLLHLAIHHKTSLITFHSPDFKLGNGKHLDFNYSQKWFQKRLIEAEIGEIEPATQWRTLRSGQAQGKILGCNLNSILKLAGTQYFPNFKNAILFLESFKENIKTVIYRLTQLKHLGVFDQITGLVIGYIYGYQDKNILKQDPKLDIQGRPLVYEDLVADLLKDYSFPILKINEFGHYFPNLILPIGAQASLDATNQKLSITTPCLQPHLQGQSL